MKKPLNATRLHALIKNTKTPSLETLYVVSGNEILLVNECIDLLRDTARKQGFTETVHLTMEANSDWSTLQAASQNTSLFGDKKLVLLSLPGGKPGRQGSEALQALAKQIKAQAQPLGDILFIIRLPYLDRATRTSKWAKVLLDAASFIEVAAIQRHELAHWIASRLGLQQQSTSPDALDWMANHVEGNLLAAHQEILKLGLLYAEGEISTENIQKAVLNVARYHVFDLRDAMLRGQSERALNILNSLKAEGQALPLVLWAVGDEVRLLARFAAARERGALDAELRQERVFGPRESQIRTLLNRIPDHLWPKAVQHAHEIDRIIKGLPPIGRLTDPWAEIARLILSIAQHA